MRLVPSLGQARPGVVRSMLREGVPGMSEWRPGVTVYIDAAAIKAIDARRGPMTRSEWIRLALDEALRVPEAGR